MFHSFRTRRIAFGTAAAVMALQLVSAPVAAEQKKELDPVHVNAIRNPELKRYRILLAGLDAFDEHRALAPTADMVRFKLFPRIGTVVDLKDLSFRISGDTFSIPIPVGEDGMFVVPRNKQAADEDADLVLNKKKNTYRWRADVRSANVPTNMRRLGDLRLECQVMIASAKEEIGFFWTATINSLLLTTNWCGKEDIHLTTKTDRKVKAATLVNGETRVKIHVTEDGFDAPLGNKAYPDNALIELEFEDQAAPAAAP